MKLCFESVDEVRDFVKNHLKGAGRGSKNAGDNDEGVTLAGPQGGQAPAPVMPPPNQAPAFNPGGAPAPQAFGGFPAAGAPAGVGGPSPEVQQIVQRINVRIDAAIASGQPQDAALGWFRGQCGAEAANATMDQIKQVFLPKLAMPQLEQIAKVMAA